MGKVDTDMTAGAQVERILRRELAKGDKALRAVAPVLSHLLSNSGFSMVNEAIVARVGGMLGHIAQQMLTICQAKIEAARPDVQSVDHLADHLAEDSAIISHLYTMAIESQYAEQLDMRQSLDPVLSPLLQELIGSDQPSTAELAMNTMAAQSRFMQSQRRMEMPVLELPADLFNLIVRRCAGYFTQQPIGGSEDFVPRIKRTYDESTTRVGLMSRLVSGMGAGARAALDVSHAGLPLFATALSAATRQPRELAVLACHERQGARLAIYLRAAGLEEAEVERQFSLIEPSERLPERIGDLTSVAAQSILGPPASRGIG